MTSSAPAAFSSRIVTCRESRVGMIRLPATSETSSRWRGRSASGLGGQERPRRRVVLARRGHGHQLALRPAQRGQLAAEDAAGVDVDRVVEPFGLRHRRVAVDDGRRPAVVDRPGAADRQPELVGLARRLAVQGELAHAAGAAALVALGHARRGRPRAARRRARRARRARRRYPRTRGAELLAARRASCSSDSASPCVICTSRPSSLRTSFTSWLPGTTIASGSPITSRSTSTTPGPRSTRSPTNASRRPSGARRRRSPATRAARPARRSSRGRRR